MTPSAELTLAVCPMTSIDDWSINLKSVLERLSQLPSGVRLVTFPENSLFMRLQEKEPIQALRLDDPRLDPISAMARQKSLWIHLGSFPVNLDGDVYNASVLVSPDGKRFSSYQKIHLFDVDIQGHRSYRESDSVRHGKATQTFEVDGWRVGQSICYDLRFPELYLQYAKLPVDLILVPSAFTVPTGEAHWHVLLRARGIECQAYVAAAAQGGRHRDKRETFGHSLVVDPWGRIIGEDQGSQETLIHTLKQELLQQVRRQIPMASHRRL